MCPRFRFECSVGENSSSRGDAVIYEPDWPNFVKWLNNWQTLLAAGIAVPFAAGAIIVPTWIESERTKRRFIAARATMPMHLSAAVGYARDAGMAIARCRTENGTNNEAIGAFEQPPIPAGLIDSLERLIEATKNKRVIRRLARMIGEIQVLDSRMSAIADAKDNGSYLDSMIIDAGLVHAQADSMFEFARGEAKTIVRRLPWRLLKTALNIMRIREGRYSSVIGMIDRFDARDRDPEYVAKTISSRLLRRRLNRAGAYVTARLLSKRSAPAT
jgi:hypothetical protein